MFRLQIVFWPGSNLKQLHHFVIFRSSSRMTARFILVPLNLQEVSIKSLGTEMNQLQFSPRARKLIHCENPIKPACKLSNPQ